MRTDIPSDLQAHLETRTTTLAWCWKIIKTDGSVLGFTNHDRPLTFGGTTYEASTGFLGTEIESQLGMAVDNMDVYGAIDSANISEEDIQAGLFDNADVTIYLVNWQDVSQRVVMKKGVTGEVKRSKTNFQAELRGLSTQLQQVKGRVYQYSCDAKLGDGRCGKDISSSAFTGTGSVVETDGSSSFTASGIDVYENKWFSSGLVTFTSGNNDGISREVKSHFKSSGVVTVYLWEALPFDLEPGDDFTIKAGCDKTFKTCKAKFENAANFRGFPHIPGSFTIVTYASSSDDAEFDGGGNFYGKD
jgi:uncharacterized phage protein (TIGR02218 family)